MTGSRRLEMSIGRVLRGGTITSTVCLTIGLLLDIAGFARLASGLLNAGLVILIATPAARVVISFVEYILERDWTFAVLTGIVLLELLASVFAAVR